MCSIQLVTVLALALVLFQTEQKALAQELVADINTFPSSFPSDLVLFQDALYFVADEDIADEQIWRYDGESPPERVTDLPRRGSQSSSSSFQPASLFPYKDAIYFRAEGDDAGGELWRYDGITPPERIADIYEGQGTSFPRNFFEYNEVLYFVASDTINNPELWRYDGTAPPENVAEINPRISPFSSGGSGSNPDNFAVFDGDLFFIAYDGNTRELWRYDGVNLPQPAIPAWSDPSLGNDMRNTILSQDALYFTGRELLNSTLTLWRYEGNDPPTPVEGADVRDNEIEFVVFQDILYYSTDGLWAYDGENAPYQVSDVFPGPSFSEARNFTLFDDALLFSASADSLGRRIWRFDGATPPQLLARAPSPIEQESMTIRSAALFEDALYFSSFELWRYDGENPIEFFADLNSRSGSGPGEMLAHVTGLYFAADPGGQRPSAGPGRELWHYDSTNPPRMVADLRPYSGDSNPTDLVLFNDNLYFVADGISVGREIFAYDFVNPPVPVTDIAPDFADANPPTLTLYQEALCFAADDGPHGTELWCYDGQSPARLITDLRPGEDGSEPEHLMVFNGLLYFAASDNNEKAVLWATDGTEVFKVVQDPNATNPTQPAWLTVFNNALYFVGEGPTSDIRDAIWRYNGASNPQAVVQTNRSGYSRPRALTQYNGALYFNAQDDNHDAELWRYDGTNPATRLAEINTAGSSFPQFLTVYAGALYFAAFNVGNQQELWRYNDTDPSTPALVAVINPGPFGADPSDLTVFRNALYFAAQVPRYGRELWRYVDPLAPTAVEPIPDPQRINVSQAYPNPFSTQTRFTVTVQDRQHVQVAIYDLLGRRVQVLYDDTLPGGEQHTFVFDAEYLPSGPYFFRIRGEHFVQSGIAMLVW